MARRPVEMDVRLEKRPSASISAGRAKPVSSAGELEQLKLGENPSVDRDLEYMYYDTDARAETAMEELFERGASVYSVRQSLSAGMLGQEQSRKLVPTRWSITATDDRASKQLREEVKQRQQIGEIKYSSADYLGNCFHVFMLPGRWEFELVELKRAGSVWNSSSTSFVASNHEPYGGRNSYASETAGAYYATRLAALEQLSSIKRQARVLVVRDVRPEYWAPLGVWVVRETARKAAESEKEPLESMQEVRSRLSRELTLNYPKVLQSSKVLQGRQSSLSDY
jgi:hypothetical protein